MPVIITFLSVNKRFFLHFFKMRTSHAAVLKCCYTCIVSEHYRDTKKQIEDEITADHFLTRKRKTLHIRKFTCCDINP